MIDELDSDSAPPSASERGPTVAAARAGVLVVYEPSAAGRAALLEAEQLSRDRGARLHVLVVVPFERENVGCGRCRQSAVIWNRELREIAADELAEAAQLLGPVSGATYESARGSIVESVARVAAREAIGEIVFPHRRRGALRSLRPDWLDQIRRAGPWTVRVGSPTDRKSVAVTR